MRKSVCLDHDHHTHHNIYVCTYIYTERPICIYMYISVCLLHHHNIYVCTYTERPICIYMYISVSLLHHHNTHDQIGWHT